MLRSLIRQLSSLPLPHSIRSLVARHKTSGSSPDLTELIATLNETIENLEEEVFIVIDALDECPDHKDKKSEREKLLSLIQLLAASGPKNLRLLATSRWENDISNALQKIRNCGIVNIEQLVEDDIAQFVENALARHPLSSWRSEVQRKIKERLLAKEK